MTANLIGKQRKFKNERFDVAPRKVHHVKHRASNYHRPDPSDAEDEEAKLIAFLTKAISWMVIIAMAPMMFFYIIRFFSPGFFLIPITPN